jgi:hypothetical protein
MKIYLTVVHNEREQISQLLEQKFKEENGDILKKILKDNKKAHLQYANLKIYEYIYSTGDYAGKIINAHDTWNNWFKENWTEDQYGNDRK